MATDNATLKAATNTRIRLKTQPNTLSPADVADPIDAGYDYVDQEVGKVAGDVEEVRQQVAELAPYTDEQAVAANEQALADKVSTTDSRLSDARTPLAHTQAASTITDFTEAVQDAVAGFLGAGSNIAVSYDDAANTFTLSAAGGSQFDPEATRDAIGAALIGVGAISVIINDAGDTITISTTATANSTDVQLRDRSTHTGTQSADTITGLATIATTGLYRDLIHRPRVAYLSGAQLDKPIVYPRFGGAPLGFSDGSQQSVIYRWCLTMPRDASNLQFIFPNFILGGPTQGSTQTTGANPITVECRIGFPAFVPITFLGGTQTIVTIPPGGAIKCDPVNLRFLGPGGQIYLHIKVSVATAGQKWPLGNSTISANNEGSANTADFDGVINGTVNINNNSALSYHPLVVLGRPNAPLPYGNVGLIGDSILFGIGDTPADLGWARRGLDAAQVPYARMACPGATMNDVLKATAGSAGPNYYLEYLTGCQRIITNFAANDLDLYNDLASFQAAHIAFWGVLRSATDAELYVPTMMPKNALSATRKAIRISYNDWLRDGAPMLNGVAVATGSAAAGTQRMGQMEHLVGKYLEAADLVETARNSNVWKTGYSGDGTHPSATGAATAAGAIVASDYLL
jgi:hypothetical protein